MNNEQYARFLFYGWLGLLAFVAATIGAAVWAARDAGRRNKSRVLVFLLVFIVQFPLGLIAWLVFRPPTAATGNARVIGGDPDRDIKQRANEGRL